jgi:hypothetical protein
MTEQAALPPPASPLPHAPAQKRRRARVPPAHALRLCWWLLAFAFLLGGAFEVFDNLLGLRQLNFESSAPAIVKVLKEFAIALLLFVAVRRWGAPAITDFGLVTVVLAVLALAPQVLAFPRETPAQTGLIYFVASLVMLLIACAIYRPSMSEDFARHFLLPVLVVTLTTQGLEALFAPASFYSEANLLGLDRRAGIAVIPTTAGMLGVVGVAAMRGWGRVVALLVILMANSSVSLVGLALVALATARRPIYVVIALPFVGILAFVAIASRSGLEASAGSRLDILAESLTQFAWFGPSSVGALATAKAVALAPFDSVIVDSFYLEVFHVAGVVPGAVLLLVLFATIYRRAGPLATALFALSGLGYLVLEAWIVWTVLLFGLPTQRRRRMRSPPPRAQAKPGNSGERNTTGAPPAAATGSQGRTLRPAPST